MRSPLTLALALAALVACTAPALASEPAATDWAGSHPIPALDAPRPVADPLALLPKIRRTTPLAISSTDGGPAGDWSLVGPQAGAERFQPGVIVDPVRGRLLAFGGADDALQATTWAFTFSSGLWTPLTTAGTAPPARRLHGAVYDPLGDRMIVFGGLGASGPLDDVWQLSLAGTPTWSRIEPTNSPGARAGFAAAFDAAANRLVVWGGYVADTSSSHLDAHAWALQLGGTPEWTDLTPAGTGPSARYAVASGWDAATRSLYVFGGTGWEDSAELWKLALAGPPAWSLVPGTGAAAPAARAWTTAGFDPVSHRFVAYGGQSVTWSDADTTWHVTTWGDVWTIDPAAGSPEWTDVTPDPNIMPRWAAGGAVSPAGDLYVVGGVNEHYSLLADVWKLHVAGPYTWQGYEDLYPPRLQEVMALDPLRHRLVAMGGTDGSYRNDVYVHPLDSGRGWAPVNPTGTKPAPRRLHTAIWDLANDRMIVFGGYDGSFYNDVWQLAFSGAGAAWTKLDPTGTPPPARAGHVAIYDPVGQRMIVSHGYDGVSATNFRRDDTWALSLSGPPAWTPLAATGAPTPRSSATAVYDSQRRRLVMFGGTSPAFLGDAWALALDDAPEWTQVAPAGSIAPREEHGAVYDEARDRMVVYGGYDQVVTIPGWPTPYYHMLGDVAALTFDGTPAWWGLEPGNAAPSPRWGMKTVYDAGDDGLWMYGGWDGTYSQQLWFLQWSKPTPPALVATTQATGLDGRAALAWQFPSPVRNSAFVQRSADGVHWTSVSRAMPHAFALPFTDHGVAPGQAYAYRTVVRAAGGDMASQAVWVTIPGGTTDVPPASARFSLRHGGRASLAGAVAVRCALAARGPARVELLDVAGRVRDARVLAGGPGETRVELGASLEAGVYFARLVQGPRVATLKAVVLR